MKKSKYPLNNIIKLLDIIITTTINTIFNKSLLYVLNGVLSIIVLFAYIMKSLDLYNNASIVPIKTPYIP